MCFSRVEVKLSTLRRGLQQFFDRSQGIKIVVEGLEARIGQSLHRVLVGGKRSNPEWGEYEIGMCTVTCSGLCSCYSFASG